LTRNEKHLIKLEVVVAFKNTWEIDKLNIAKVLFAVPSQAGLNSYLFLIFL
jgi:hypothetical protein